MTSKRTTEKRIANTMMGLSHPRRVRLFQIIDNAQTPPNYKSLRAITGFSPQVLSHHLSMMLNARLIQKQRKGSHSLYRTKPKNIDHALSALSALNTSKSPLARRVSSSAKSYLDS